MQNKSIKMKTQASQNLHSDHPLLKYKRISQRNNELKKNMPLFGASVKKNLKQVLAQELSNANRDHFNLFKMNKKNIKTNHGNRLQTQQLFNQNSQDINQCKIKMRKQRLLSQNPEKTVFSPGKKIMPPVNSFDKSINSQAVMLAKERRSYQFNKQKNQVPGPGRYQVENMNKTSFTFTKARKFKQAIMFYKQKQRIPGPSQYKTQQYEKISRKNIIFDKAERNSEDLGRSPGPGDYKTQISLLNHNGGTISRAKRSSEYKTEGPGPAAYKQISIDLVKTRYKMITIGRSKRIREEINQGPGPSYYNKQKSYEKDKIIGGVISTTPRIKDNKEISLTSSLSYNPSFKNIEKKASAVVQQKYNASIGTQPRFTSSANLPFLLEMAKNLQNSQISNKNNRLLNDLRKMNETVNDFSKKQKAHNYSSLSTNK